MLDIEITFVNMEKFDQTPQLIQSIVKEIAYFSEGAMKRNVNVDKGRLRSSITTEIKQDMAIVAPHTDYAAAQNWGLPGGPGRYVPAIGKRLIPSGRGWWPGFKGKFYIEKTAAEVEAKAPPIIDAIIRSFYGE